MDALRPNPGAVVRQAQSLIHKAASEHTMPRVEWAGIDEPAERFAQRVAPLVRGGRLILAVIPHGYATPPGVQRVELPVKHFRVLHPTRPARYRVLKGGRGSAKSWSIARALILTALSRPTRTGCFREIQKSMRDSVLRLLGDQIESMGLWRYFDVGAQSITACNGSEFIFEGLWANVQKIKSLEGLDYAWVEEAALISSDSWRILTPTVRKPGSEILVNYNPDGADDPTNMMFAGDQPRADATVEHVTWADNPYFPEVLRPEMEYLARVDADAYRHVWLGETRSHSDAQILKGKVTIEAFEPAPEWAGPYLGLDFGFSQDPTAAVKCWVADRTLYIEHEAYQIGCDIDRTPALLDQVPAARAHRIRADSARPETISYLRRNGFPMIESVEKWSGSVEDGVAHLRSYERIVIHPRCPHAIEEARLYSYKTDRLSGDVLPDIVDRHNHLMDALRYALAPLIKRSSADEYMKFLRGQMAADAQGARSLTERPGVVVKDLVSPWHQP
jgi:phage terminase large subunit